MSDLRSYSKDFIREFIELYKSFPCLWKTKCKEYMNRTKKDAAYETLLKKLQEVEPTSTKKSVKAKINSIRGSFRRELKKIEESKRSGAGTDEIYVTHLWYFDLLLFCKDQEVPRTSVNNIDNQETEQPRESDQENDDEGEETQNLEDVTDCESIAIRSTPSTSRSCTTTYSQLDSTTPIPTASRKSSKKGKGKDEQQVDDVLTMVGERLRSNNEDPCNIFGKNVGAKLKTLPKETRLYTKKLINELLFEAEMGNSNKNTRIVTSSGGPTNQTNQFFPLNNTNNTGIIQPTECHTSLAYRREPQLTELLPLSRIYQLPSGPTALQVSSEPQIENVSSFFESYQPNNH